MPRDERELIGDIARLAGKARTPLLRIGIGDDCAVLRAKSADEMLVTTDLSIEGVHFRREWHPARSVGHRCLTRGLSDIAAMGGKPLAAFLSLALPQHTPARWISGFLSGLLDLATGHSVTLAGGDTSSATNGIVADIVVIGSVPRGRAVLRSGARSGDAIYVTGPLGAASAMLRKMYSGARFTRSHSNAHLWPTPQIELGIRLRNIANAMIDTSDGLSIDLAHICEASNISAIVDETAIPLARGATLDDALHGGEDYQLLFTASPHARIPRHCVRIGEVTNKKRTHPVLVRSGEGALSPLPAHGWQHLSLIAP